MRKIDFNLYLIPLESGGYNFDLKVAGPVRTPGYFSPLASYIDRARAIRWARHHAQIIVRQFNTAIGNIQITRGER